MPSHLEKSGCNPYAAYGYLTVNRDVPTENVWRTFEKDCQPPKLMEKMLEGIRRGKNDAQSTDHLNDMPWVQHRT